MNDDKGKPRAHPAEGKRPVVIDRGSSSGSGEAMPDEKALALLRRRSAPEAESPDINVIIKEPAMSPGQITLTGTSSSPEKPAWSPEETHYVPLALKHRWPSRHEHWSAHEHSPHVLATANLDSTVASLLGRYTYSLIRDKESLWMRLFLDDLTVDLTLPKTELADSTITLRELIDRFGSER